MARNLLEFFSKKKVMEKLDDKPVALPVGFKHDPEKDRLQYLMRTLVHDLEVKGVIPNQAESFEESLDFELGDDEDGDVVFAANSGGVSPSEMKYMQEERLLTEAEEVASMAMQRRAAANWRNRDGQRNYDKGRKESDGDGSRVAGEKRGEGDKQSAQLGSDAGVAEKSGK